MDKGQYLHHGVYLGHCKVIHFHGDDKSHAKIKESSVEEFLKPHDMNQRIFKLEYKNKAELLSQCETICKAAQVLKDPRLFGEYHPTENNCETFATWLKTGKKHSMQAESGKKQIMLYVLAAILVFAVAFMVYRKKMTR